MPVPLVLREGVKASDAKDVAEKATVHINRGLGKGLASPPAVLPAPHPFWHVSWHGMVLLSMLSTQASQNIAQLGQRSSCCWCAGERPLLNQHGRSCRTQRAVPCSSSLKCLSPCCSLSDGPQV